MRLAQGVDLVRVLAAGQRQALGVVDLHGETATSRERAQVTVSSGEDPPQAGGEVAGGRGIPCRQGAGSALGAGLSQFAGQHDRGSVTRALGQHRAGAVARFIGAVADLQPLARKSATACGAIVYVRGRSL